jgi:methionine synthase II (cobalamin-independent)
MMDWNFATTLIGSLPCKTAKEAVDKALGGHVECPSWPQLPKRGNCESMYLQTGGHLPGIGLRDDKIIVDLDNYDPTEAYMAILEENVDYFFAEEGSHAGLYEFLGRDLSKYKAIKGQVTGPISEGLQVEDATGRPVIYDESYSEIVRKTVNLTAKWQVRELKKLNDNVIMFFDEPSISLLGTPFASISDDQAVAWINEAVEGVDAMTAIHCCGNTNWPLVMSTNIQIVNFDAYVYGKNITLFPDEIKAFLEKGGALAWGIVPNSSLVEGETPETISDLLMGFIDELVRKGVDRDLLIRRSLITPQCGLGGTDDEFTDFILELLDGTSKEMRRRCGL